MTTEILQKNAKKFCCKFCNFNANNKNNYEIHLQTKKHKNNEILQNTTKILQNNAKKYICECGKEYSHHSSLYKHKKSCIINNNDNMIIHTENKEDMKDLVMKLIDENKELRKTITEIVPKIGNNNNNNNIKQKFNINLFLNEKCKDALSMDQFIDKIEISIKNLLTSGDKGQAQGVTDIIMDNMNRLSIYERPLHCTDKKKETLYIKTDEWECDENKNKINNAIKKIEAKQFKNIKNWVDQHPNYMTNEKEQDEFLKIVKETSNSIEENREKVIKNLCNIMETPLIPFDESYNHNNN
jgi:hypothetical protein|tara:strand:- start:1567 stop:2460 length:894 start_codon:yes stop_codon:yes gene_type:complete